MNTRVRRGVPCSFQRLIRVLFSVTESSAVATLANEAEHHSQSLKLLSETTIFHHLNWKLLYIYIIYIYIIYIQYIIYNIYIYIYYKYKHIYSGAQISVVTWRTVHEHIVADTFNWYVLSHHSTACGDYKRNVY